MDGDSPSLNDVVPSSAVTNTYINFYGIHRINHEAVDPRDTQDVEKF